MRTAVRYSWAFLVLLAYPAEAAAQQLSDLDPAKVYDSVYDLFYEVAARQADIYADAAQGLFLALALCSLAWTFIQLILKQATIVEIAGEFIRFSLFTSFWLWMMENGPANARLLYTELMKLGGAGTANAAYSPGGIIFLGYDVFAAAVTSISLLSPVDSAAAVLLAVLFNLLTVWMASELLILLCAGWFVAFQGVFVLGFGGSRWTSDMAMNYYRLVLSLALQAMATIALVQAAETLVRRYVRLAGDDIALGEYLIMVCSAGIMALLVKRVPQQVGGLAAGGSLVHRLANGSGALDRAAGKPVSLGAKTAAAVAGGAAAGAVLSAAEWAARRKQNKQLEQAGGGGGGNRGGGGKGGDGSASTMSGSAFPSTGKEDVGTRPNTSVPTPSAGGRGLSLGGSNSPSSDNSGSSPESTPASDDKNEAPRNNADSGTAAESHGEGIEGEEASAGAEAHGTSGSSTASITSRQSSSGSPTDDAQSNPGSTSSSPAVSERTPPPQSSGTATMAPAGADPHATATTPAGSSQPTATQGSSSSSPGAQPSASPAPTAEHPQVATTPTGSAQAFSSPSKAPKTAPTRTNASSPPSSPQPQREAASSPKQPSRDDLPKRAPGQPPPLPSRRKEHTSERNAPPTGSAFDPSTDGDDLR